MKKTLTRRRAAALGVVGVIASSTLIAGFAIGADDEPTTASCTPAPPVSTTDAGDQSLTVTCSVPTPPPVTTTVTDTVTETATATVTVTATPSPTTTPTPPALEDRVDGTWVLQQVQSVAELNSMRTRLLDAAELPGVVGISIRFPWDAADITGSATTHPILDAARDIADESGKELSIRFMAGAHTPARIFTAGAAYYLKNATKVPLPWSNSTGNHEVFVDAYDAYVGKLAAWSKANDVALLHLSWWGQDWAELNHGAEVRAAAGYTQDKWLAGQKQLIAVGAKYNTDDLAVELPLSGYGPLSGGQSAALADEVLRVSSDDLFFVQANGLGPNGEWGAPSATVENDFDRIWTKPVIRGVQMIQPQDYDWSAIYDNAEGAGATYVEIYLPSFTLTNRNQLRAEIAAFQPAA